MPHELIDGPPSRARRLAHPARRLPPRDHGTRAGGPRLPTVEEFAHWQADSELARLDSTPESFVIVGSGKTATDGIVWLLRRGARHRRLERPHRPEPRSHRSVPARASPRASRDRTARDQRRALAPDGQRPRLRPEARRREHVGTKEAFDLLNCLVVPGLAPQLLAQRIEDRLGEEGPGQRPG